MQAAHNMFYNWFLLVRQYLDSPWTMRETYHPIYLGAFRVVTA
jgi:hypothetical protein